ncbi:hypothetical protein CAI21_00825 [Alkalilimnicola ehrlichii]|uniref:Uncharacterized protein n=1 Tax=Alkalilimnicola ehrlichii TaxID=351052 RepID=A0A3E0X1Y7_9GAMM|nr:hypothetical protein CAI21_00825 [Alkalilimnicola ehrlichii]RFA39497.1 hypothetical protein CAL65_01585 [Alkalilimnicola ehrlichii]
MGVVTVELEGVSADMRAEAQGLMADAAQWLSGVLDLGRREGDFQFAGDAYARALLILAALQGALQLSRLTERAAFERVLQQIWGDLGVALPRTSPAK